jgi:predicted DNA-binding antitoxin AbrB/MazE fold protein
MSQHVDAVFENGVFRPEQPLNIANGARVSLTVDSHRSHPDDLADIEDLLDHEFMASCRQLAANAPSLEETRQTLERFKGSLSGLISHERGL